MMKSVQRALTFGLLLAVSGLASAEVMLKEGHPSTYYVKNGDTLWDISGRFLEHPWQWPEIWQINDEISNPHLIYPGDEIHLTYVDGEPRLTVKRGVQETKMPNGVVKLTPRVREVANDTAIPALPMSDIQAYLKDGLVLERDEIAKAPYVVGGQDRRVVFGEGDTVYARDVDNEWQDMDSSYGFFRVGEQYVDPDTQEVLGYEARQIGTGSVAGHNDDMLTLHITRSSEDVRIDDRLFSTSDRRVRAVLYPSAPDNKIEAKIIRFFDRLNSVARGDVVVINKGIRDGLKEGNVLDVYGEGEVVRDRQKGDMVQLPRSKTGTLVVFRVFDKVSYALVMTSTRPIYMNDAAESPAGSY
ncbi:LysM domain-containing protein [Alcanivorax hongdengensis A-11-3]|uniref:LysM domain-containing protein n=1 Tax=Alcanivorax hongdengensis A-11-3 TaxID=1177179 RepID=L0WBF7_9GAMM|nr:LysM peptidoglycan-binding domain-containing protein [Alcanivorax hongdengensis]EKF74301.1 LysM domain-containing protein [Alcanivorax hongdengensis A-11-3]